MWNPRTTTAPEVIRGHKEAVTSVVLLQDGSHVISASADGAVKFWLAATGEEKKTLTGHKGAVLGLAISDSKEPVLATAGADATVQLWNADPASKDDLRLLNNLVLVKDRPVRIQLRSMDVLHSFFLPNFRVKQDAIPGMTVTIWFTPKELTNPDKVTEIACAEHCGLGH